MSRHPRPEARLATLAPAALRQSFVKLDPRSLSRNPVIFTTAVVAGLTTVLALPALATDLSRGLTALHISAWLWIAVLFANFAEALAEGRGRARADSLRASRSETPVKLLASAEASPASATLVPSAGLRKGQILLVEAGDLIPADAEVIRGVASVDESAITGESAPVIRESGGDRSSVTGARASSRTVSCCASPPSRGAASSTG